VANFTDRTIYRVTGTDLEYVATVPGPSNGVLGFITGAGGTLYGTSWHSHAIYAIEPAYMDSVRLVAGGNGQGNADGEVSTAQIQPAERDPRRGRRRHHLRVRFRIEEHPDDHRGVTPSVARAASPLFRCGSSPIWSKPVTEFAG
jgi:hypothetical protein